LVNYLVKIYKKMTTAQLILNENEANFLSGLSKTYYMRPIKERIDSWVRQSEHNQVGWREVLDHLNEILVSAKDDIEEFLDERLAFGEICDKSQAFKSIAKVACSNAIIYSFIQNKLVKNISEKIFITSNKSIVPNFNSLVTINVGNEIQKLETDLVIYSLKENSELNHCIILSLKTSLKQSLDQIEEWKLLMEIAMSDCEVRDKYEISYNPPTIPLVCFVTVNFYNEINNPQHRGMFKFFDRAFIGKPIDPQSTNFISPLSSLIDFANTNLQ